MTSRFNALSKKDRDATNNTAPSYLTYCLLLKEKANRSKQVRPTKQSKGVCTTVQLGTYNIRNKPPTNLQGSTSYRTEADRLRTVAALRSWVGVRAVISFGFSVQLNCQHTVKMRRELYILILLALLNKRSYALTVGLTRRSRSGRRRILSYSSPLRIASSVAWATSGDDLGETPRERERERERRST